MVVNDDDSTDSTPADTTGSDAEAGGEDDSTCSAPADIDINLLPTQITRYVGDLMRAIFNRLLFPPPAPSPPPYSSATLSTATQGLGSNV